VTLPKERFDAIPWVGHLRFSHDPIEGEFCTYQLHHGGNLPPSKNKMSNAQGGGGEMSGL